MCRIAGRLIGCALLVVIAVLDGALAQVLPPSADPSRVRQRFEPPPLPPRPAPPDVPRLPERGLPQGTDDVRFVLSEVRIEGATVYGANAFRPLYGELIGQEISLDRIFRITQSITAKYRSDGYVLSQALLPAQRIEGGVVRVQIIEGFVDAFRIEGEPRGGSELIAAYAEKIVASRPLQNSDLERYLLLMNDLPGLRVRSVLLPSPDTPGAANMTLVVEEKRLDAVGSIDNRGTKFLGRSQYLASLAANSLLSRHERMQLQYVGAPTTSERELSYVSGSYQQPIFDEGTTLSVFASRSDTEPGSELEDLEIEGESTTLILSAAHPFIRSRRQNLSVALQFDVRNSETDIFGTQLFSKDRLRILRARMQYDLVDAWAGVNLVDVELSQGLNIFGASDDSDANLSRADGRSDFFKVAATAQRVQDLGFLKDGLGVLVSVGGQKSANALLAVEEFGLGGIDFGRAYDPSELTGDDALAARIELRQDFDEVLSQPTELFQVYGYYDIGRVWNRGDVVGQASDESLASAGVGVRFAVTDWLSGSLEAGKPLTRRVEAEGDREWRGFFSFRVEW